MQPSIEQPLKCEPSHAATTFAIYVALTRRAGAERPGSARVARDGVCPRVLRRDPVLLERSASLPAQLRDAAPGRLDRRRWTDSARAHATARFSSLDEGIGAGMIRFSLVPFGEYVPLSG